MLETSGQNSRGDRKKEGLQLASQSISLRRGIFGSKGPRVADSISLVSQMMAERGQHTVAPKMLREVVDMSLSMGEMHGQLVLAHMVSCIIGR
jgi:hypothetical protein